MFTMHVQLGLTVILLYVGSGVAQNVCDDGWLPYGSNCYKFFTTKSVSVASAQAECVRSASSLVRIHSQDELNWITTTAKAKFPSSGFWTDLNDNPKNSLSQVGTGNWTWGSFENADISLITWGVSPANDGVANCAGVNILGTLSDLDCAARQGFVCKMDASNGCPLGWLSTDTSCFWISDTTDPSQMVTWSAAKAWCSTPLKSNATGAQLMSISVQDDVDFLTNNLPYQGKTAVTYWLGYTYANGQWSWIVPSASAVSLPWQQSPNNVAGVENCGVLRMNGMFDDRNCSSMANFICYQQQYNTQAPDNQGCGQWIRAGKLCYGFIGGSKVAAWQDAKSYCKQHSANLVKVDSFDKQAWLNMQMLDPANDKFMWTGMNDISTEGQYVWSDSSSVNQSYINWNQEPNDYKGQEDCGLISSSGYYNDMSCQQQVAAICEIDNLASCPSSSWVANNNNCYFFTPYKNKTALMNQLEAASFCNSLSVDGNHVGALLSVESAAEHDFIKNQVTNPQYADNAVGWWTSMSDQQTEGYWTFATGPIFDPSLVDWNGEPSTKPDDDCGVITFAGAYHMRPCSWQLNFICERYAYGVTGGAASVTISMFSILTLVLSTRLVV